MKINAENNKKDPQSEWRGARYNQRSGAQKGVSATRGAVPQPSFFNQGSQPSVPNPSVSPIAEAMRGIPQPQPQPPSQTLTTKK